MWERSHIKWAHHDLVKGATARKNAMMSRFDSSRYPEIFIMKARDTRSRMNWDRQNGRRDMARINTVRPALVGTVKDGLKGYCEDESNSETCKAFEVLI